MLFIESKNNNLFKETKKLKEKKHREKAGKFLIEGLRFVDEAIKSEAEIEKVFFTESFKEKHEDFLEEISSIEQIILSEPLLKELSFTEKPQGIIALVSIPNKEIKDKDIIVLVDKVQDPGNLGTIIRTAHAVDAAAVVITKGTVDVYNDKTLRSTMGSIFKMPIIEDSDLSLLKKLKEDNFKLVVSSLQGENNFFEEDLKGKIIIAVGNEGNGISEEVYQLADKRVKIPMPGEAESLNVAVATSVMLYEKIRQNLLK